MQTLAVSELSSWAACQATAYALHKKHLNGMSMCLSERAVGKSV